MVIGRHTGTLSIEGPLLKTPNPKDCLDSVKRSRRVADAAPKLADMWRLQKRELENPDQILISLSFKVKS